MKKKPLVAWDRGQRLEFPSLTEAAEYYNTNISSISCAIKRNSAWRRVVFEYVDSITSPVLPQEREKDGLVVTIKDGTYYSVKAPNKTNCEDCDFSPIDEEMCATEWCEEMCGSDEQTDAKCWQRYFDLKRKED